jgi:predicted Ser/Thr protein kinase
LTEDERNTPDETTPVTTPGSRREPASRHGRFLPGAMFGKRYRILGLLGRGGMGEVYKAEDLELGQIVALKLLPAGLAAEAATLDLLRNEVRVARHVSHPNVCRVYDIGEVDGQYFVSMEYVDGEDLASLLRRIGRLSKEKSLDIIAQLVAGLAAAHHLGVLHRDLKPANIMVDGHGRVRIMDFGLAGFARELRDSKELAGTVTYMAPEQLAGKGVTTRSDVYALGLVMYEILTGRRAFEWGSVDELRRAHAGAPPPMPSSMVSDLDPAVERVVMWCLEADPARRPSSAQAVAKVLPVGDPLAVALAAGETPSPEMVAAAGGQGGMRRLTAIFCLAGIMIGMLVIAGLNNRAALFRLAKLDKPPVVLADRARQVLSTLGFAEEPRSRAYGLELDAALLRHIEQTDSSTDRWGRLKTMQYPVYGLWYRESPWPLVPYDTQAARITYYDPPMVTPGMAYVHVNTAGRLLAFEAVAESVNASTAAPDSVDWSALFEEAEIDPSGLEKTAASGLKVDPDGRKWQGPDLSPRVPVDHMTEWRGLSPWGSADSIKVRAGSYHGKPVFFATHITYESPAGSRPGGSAEGDSADGSEAVGGDDGQASGFGSGVAVGTGEDRSENRERPAAYSAGVVAGVVIGFATLALVLVVLVGGPFMAWRNLRMGRGDRRGALRFGLFAFGLILMNGLLLADHAILVENRAINLGYEFGVLLSKLGMAVLYGAYVALAYLALEPYVRRHWPDALISWTRLLRSKAGDSLVGRDLLLGSASGVLMALLWQMTYIAPAWFGWAPPRPSGVEMGALEGGARAIAAFVAPGFLIPAMLGILSLVVLVIVFRRRWVAIMVLAFLVIGIGALVGLGDSGRIQGPGLVTTVCIAAIAVLLLVLFVRSGLLALTAAFFFFSKIRRFPMTLDSSAWYASTSTLLMLALAAIAVYAFSNAIRSHTRATVSGPQSSAPELPPQRRPEG